MIEVNPVSKATSLTRVGFRSSFFAVSTRTRERYSVKFNPVAFLNILQK